MKNNIYFVLMFFAFFGVKAQNTTSTCETDTIKLQANNLQKGTLEWQKSNDNINWERIPNESDSKYLFVPKTSAYYRVANKFAYCEPNYSPVTFVETKPQAILGKERIVTDTLTYINGNKIPGTTATWSIVEGVGGTIESPNSPRTKFYGYPNGVNGSTGEYILKYKLENTCGVSSDLIKVTFVENDYYSDIVIVDDTDTILSTSQQLENGEYNITFSSPVTITNETILIGIVGDGFMKKVESFTQNGNTYTMTTSQAKLEEILESGGLDAGQLYNLEAINQTLTGKNSIYNKLSHKPTRAEILSNPYLQKGNHVYLIEDEIKSSLEGVSYEKFTNSPSFSSSNTSSDEKFIEFDFNDTTLYNSNGLSAVLNGSLTFEPNVVADIETSFLSLKRVNIGVENAELSFNSKLSLNANVQTSLDHDFNLFTLKKSVLILIGGVPTLIQIKTKLNGNIKASVEGNIDYVNEYTKTYSVSAGIKYEDDEWDNYFSDNVQTDITNDFNVNAQADTQLEIGPSIYFTINGLGGPYVHTKMTTDLGLCVNSQNFDTPSWQGHIDLGAKLTVGAHAYLFKKQLFDYSKTFESGSLFKDEFPYSISYFSGNNQEYVEGQTLDKPLKVIVKSKHGFPVPGVPVTYEVLDNTGSLSESTAITDFSGVAETNFTPSANDIAKIKAYVKDCNNDYIDNAPLVFTATKTTNTNTCDETTLSSYFLTDGDTITLMGSLGELPYTYSTDFINFTETPISIVLDDTENSYLGVVKDANGCTAVAYFHNNDNTCEDTTIAISEEVIGQNVIVNAMGGVTPYTYALDNGTFVENNTFTNLTSGEHTVTVKDTNGCTNSRTVDVDNATDDLIAYFSVPQNIYREQSFTLNNLSSNATTYSWDFGDGDTSTAMNPNHTYNATGIYTVTLTVGNGTEETVFSKQVTVGTIANGTYPADHKIFVQGGTFQMGSNDGSSDEQPVHGVTLNDFYIGKYEVTNAQYASFLNAMGNQTEGSYTWLDINDGECQIEQVNGTYQAIAGKENYPVMNVNWYGAKAYAEWVGGRLPTEAEWEYAARGGSQSQGYVYSGSNNIDEVAWYYGNSQNADNDMIDGLGLHIVGTKQANELGIYDMSGNVYEWCNDWYASSYSNTSQVNPTGPDTGTYRVLRGGSWDDLAYGCRVANRFYNYPTGSGSYLGFRVVFLP